jgi:ribulose-5-phosphate 4-epimerase/fuculose-1-phosphate aldolase
VNAAALAAARDLCAAGRTLAAQGLAPGTSGNISLRVDGGYVMTPTNASLGELVPERISLLDERGEHAEGDAPTKERALHVALYEQRPDARAIVHTHSTYAVALACLCEVDPENVLRPLTPYALMRVGRLVLAPYARPGSRALVDRVAARAGDSHAILLSNHGPIVAGSTLAAAVAAVCEIEEAAKVQLLVHGRDVRLLSAADIAELAASS